MSGIRHRRIAMVSPNYYPVTCGVGDFSMRLGNELASRGAAVQLFTHQPARPNPECPSVPVSGVGGGTQVAIADAMREAIQRFAPTDLVVQYAPVMLGSSRYGSPAIPLVMAGLRDRVRITTILHELYFPWSWRPDLALGSALQRLQFGATVGMSERIFVTIASRKKTLEAALHAAGRKTEVELLFIGANAEPVPARKQGGPRRLGTFSMLGRFRRFDLLVDALALVNERHPGTELVIVGDMGSEGSPRLRALKSHIAKSPVGGQVRFTGTLPLRLAAEQVARLDVYLFPDEGGATTRSGTLPVAFGSGIPVIATRRQDTATDVFREGENILFASQMTAAALAHCALRVLDESHLADTLSAGGRQLFETHFSWEAIGQRLFPSQEILDSAVSAVA